MSEQKLEPKETKDETKTEKENHLKAKKWLQLTHVKRDRLETWDKTRQLKTWSNIKQQLNLYLFSL